MKRNKILALLAVASMVVSMTAPVGVVSAAEVSTEEVTIEVVEDVEVISAEEVAEIVSTVTEEEELPEGAVKEGAFTAVGDTIIAFEQEIGGLDIVIPEEIGGVTITKLGDSLFYATVLDSVVMPDSITEIGEYTFCYQSGDNVKLSKNLKKIGRGAFQNNSAMQLDTLPDGLEEIGYMAFARSTILNEETIVIPDSVTTMGSATFWFADVTSVKLGSGITTIPESTFHTSTLSEVEIPEGITEIGQYAFNYCNLTEVNIPSSVTTIAEGAFNYCKLTQVSIPSSVTSIENNVFMGNDLTKVSIPSSVTSIGEWAFCDNALTEVNIPSSVTSIGRYAFSSNNLTGVSIPSSVTSIGAGAFGWNLDLKIAYIPDTLLDIAEDAFPEDCEIIRYGVITDTITFLGGIGAKIISSILDVAGDVYTLLANMANEMGYNSVFSAYEFTLTEGDITDGITVSFDLGTENNGRKALVLHQKQDGEVETFESEVENGIVTATVYELSPFMVALVDESVNTESEEVTGDTVEDTAADTVEDTVEDAVDDTVDEATDEVIEVDDTVSTDDSTNPKTGDTTNIMVWVLLMMATLALGVVTLNKKENN